MNTGTLTARSTLPLSPQSALPGARAKIKRKNYKQQPKTWDPPSPRPAHLDFVPAGANAEPPSRQEQARLHGGPVGKLRHASVGLSRVPHPHGVVVGTGDPRVGAGRGRG